MAQGIEYSEEIVLYNFITSKFELGKGFNSIFQAITMHSLYLNNDIKCLFKYFYRRKFF